MNRVLFGNTGAYTGPSIHGPDAGGGNPDYFNRENETGLFISKPGQDVLTCNSAELLFSTDSSSNGFLMVVGKGTVLANPTDDIDVPNETKVSTGILIPHGGDSASLMVNWFPIAGMGRQYGSNIYDCMGGNGQESWDGNGSADNGLPNGYNELYTGNDETTTWRDALGSRPAYSFLQDENDFSHNQRDIGKYAYNTEIGVGMRRKHFWQIPDVGVNNYHLSNTVVTNDPSAFFWTWIQNPPPFINLEGTPIFTDWEGGSETVQGGEGGYNIKTGSFTGEDRLPERTVRSLGGGIRTEGDFLYCESSSEQYGSTDHSELILKFYNGHTIHKYQISWMVYRERGAF